MHSLDLLLVSPLAGTIGEMGSEMKLTCRSFQLLDDVLERATEGDDKAAGRVRQMLENTAQSTDHFESAIMRCLTINDA